MDIGQRSTQGFEGKRLWANLDKPEDMQKAGSGHTAGVSTYTKSINTSLLEISGKAVRFNINGEEFVIGRDSLKKFAARHMPQMPKDWNSIRFGDALNVIQNTTRSTIKSIKMTKETLQELVKEARSAGIEVNEQQANALLSKLASKQHPDAKTVTEFLRAFRFQSNPETARLAQDASNEQAITRAQMMHEEAHKATSSTSPSQMPKPAATLASKPTSQSTPSAFQQKSGKEMKGKGQ